MTENFFASLRRLLVDDYHGLRERLARRYGSPDLATELLHEAWLKLDRAQAGGSTMALRNPRAYLYRIAINLAADRGRSERARITAAELDALHRRAHDELDPGRIAEAKMEVAALSAAINQLPARRRAIFIAARLEELPYKEIAARHGVTIRVVDRELSLALNHLGEVLNKNRRVEGGTGGREPSSS